MTRTKTYIIKFSDDERATLNKSQILLDLDEVHGTGLTHAQLAHSYAVFPDTITNIIQSYVRNGIKDIIHYNIILNSSAALRKVNGGTEAILSKWPMVLCQMNIPAGRFCF
jgi:hypothetical protein